MGIKDDQGKFYVPNTLDEELLKNDAYVEKSV